MCFSSASDHDRTRSRSLSNKTSGTSLTSWNLLQGTIVQELTGSLDYRSTNSGDTSGMSRATAIFTGFDSAWTATNRGAIAHAQRVDGVLALVPPEIAGF